MGKLYCYLVFAVLLYDYSIISFASPYSVSLAIRTRQLMQDLSLDWYPVSCLCPVSAQLLCTVRVPLEARGGWLYSDGQCRGGMMQVRGATGTGQRLALLPPQAVRWTLKDGAGERHVYKHSPTYSCQWPVLMARQHARSRLPTAGL